MAHIAPLAIEDVDPEIRDSLRRWSRRAATSPEGSSRWRGGRSWSTPSSVMLAAVRLRFRGAGVEEPRCRSPPTSQRAARTPSPTRPSGRRATGSPSRNCRRCTSSKRAICSHPARRRRCGWPGTARSCRTWPPSTTSRPCASGSNDGEIVELVAVISWRGFLNHWNNIVATETHPVPAGFAREHLSSVGWEGRQARVARSRPGRGASRLAPVASCGSAFGRPGTAARGASASVSGLRGLSSVGTATRDAAVRVAASIGAGGCRAARTTRRGRGAGNRRRASRRRSSWFRRRAATRRHRAVAPTSRA